MIHIAVMGVEFLVVNHDKNEFLNLGSLHFGHKLGSTLDKPTSAMLAWLLINPDGFIMSPPMMGRWAGDRVEIIGNEGEKSEQR